MANFSNIAIPVFTTIAIILGVVIIEVSHWRKTKLMTNRRVNSIAIIDGVRSNNDSPELENRFILLLSRLDARGLTLHTDLEGCTEHE